MAETSASLKLTHEGALAALNAGIAKATAMGQPQCISIVDPGGHLLRRLHVRLRQRADRHR